MTVALVFVAMLVAVNPPRRAIELDPRPGRDVALLGAGIVLAILVAAAWWSGPILDALDVSAPTMRIAAGFVLAFRGLLDLFLRPKPEPEGYDGLGEALVPIAFPVLFRPEVALVALSAGADQGVAVTAVAAAVALGLAIIAPGRRALALVISTAEIAVGVFLIVDGVFDI